MAIGIAAGLWKSHWYCAGLLGNEYCQSWVTGWMRQYHLVSDEALQDMREFSLLNVADAILVKVQDVRAKFVMLGPGLAG